MKNIGNLFVRLFVISLLTFRYFYLIVSLFGAGAAPFFWLRLRLRPKCVGSGGSGSGSDSGSASLIMGMAMASCPRSDSAQDGGGGGIGKKLVKRSWTSFLGHPAYPAGHFRGEGRFEAEVIALILVRVPTLRGRCVHVEPVCALELR